MDKSSCKRSAVDLISPIENGHLNELRLPKVVPNAFNGYSITGKDNQIKYRLLKLVHKDEIRNAIMPVNSSFKILKTVIRKIFPRWKGVMIKFIDSDGELTTMRCSSQLRLAESLVDNGTIPSAYGRLRLHIIEVHPKQELFLSEGQQEDEEPECKGVETVISEEAQEEAISSFHKVNFYDFFNFGNVFMCQAQLGMNTIEWGPKEQLKNSYDFVGEKYKKAKRYYKMTTMIDPDFFKGLLALGQLHFEKAKLLWSFVLEQKSDLSMWDPTKMISLFDSAEKKIRAAAKAWEKMEKQDKEEEVMSSQILLLGGNVLFVRSHIECLLGLSGWEMNLDAALKRFTLAGLSDEAKEELLREHCSGDRRDG